MSEIPFVNQLGDALEQAVTGAAPRHRRRVPGRRWRLIAVLAVLVVGGSAAAATTLFNSTQRLAINGIGCYDGTTDGTSATYDVYGRSPIAACRQVYRSQHSPLGRPGVKLVACVGGQGPLAMVFQARGRDQCRRLGFSPLPATYAAAVSSVSAVQRAMVAVYQSRNCIAPTEFAHKVAGVLARLGWSGWRVRFASPAGTGGPCGNVGYDSSGQPSATGTMEAGSRTVFLFTGPSRSIQRMLVAVAPVLADGSGRRCFTLAGARRFTLSTLAPYRLPVAFAVSREPRGEGFGSGRQPRYDRGCAIITSVTAGPDGRTVDVWINERTAPKLPAPRAFPHPAYIASSAHSLAPPARSRPAPRSPPRAGR